MKITRTKFDNANLGSSGLFSSIVLGQRGDCPIAGISRGHPSIIGRERANVSNKIISNSLLLII